MKKTNSWVSQLVFLMTYYSVILLLVSFYRYLLNSLNG